MKTLSFLPEQDRTTDVAILDAMQQAQTEITARLAPHAIKKTMQRHTKGYGPSLLLYTRHVQIARKHFFPRLASIAGAISSLGGAGWEKNPHIVQLWLEMAHTLQMLRHNPLKGPGGLYVSHDNKVITMAAGNFWLPGMKMPSRLRKRIIESKSRQRLCVCMERAGLTYAIGLHKFGSVLDFTRRTNKRKPLPLNATRKRMRLYNQKLRELATTEEIFRRSYLVITADPCRQCFASLVAAGVAGVITDADTHRHAMSARRQKTMRQAPAAARNNGMDHRHVERRNGLTMRDKVLAP
jgi:hypothetical protein